MGSRSSHMTQSDLFTWSMEQDPMLRSTIVTILLLDAEPDWAKLVRMIDRGTRVVPRFRHTLSPVPLSLAPPRWKPDQEFDLFWHIRRATLARPADMAAVLEFARTEAMTAFDPARPLWKFTLLTGMPGGKCAAVLTVHHSLTDGIGGIQIAGEILDFSREGTERGPIKVRNEPGTGTLADIVAWNWATGTRLLTGSIARTPKLMRSLADPIGAVRGSATLATLVLRLARPVTKTLSPVMTDRSLGRYLTVLQFPLKELSDSALRVECTLNDAFLTAIVLGLREYHARYDAPVHRLRLTMPISLRTPDDPIGGNRITLARFAIPADTDNALKQMWQVHTLVERWRREPAIPLSNAVAAVFNRMPSRVLAEMLKHVDFVASDVPGSPIPLYLAGAEVEHVHAFGPTLGTAFNATLLSHLGTCHIGLTIDTAAVPDIADFVACIDSGFRKILAAGLPNSSRAIPQ
ncbi:wax ester/triacylglycerol synthase domain-containing protein [Nocardia carnea]|uniref:diacylglycerol O-acyltransferase n=2 Tax=Nocardia carnea TaxID=37328 RepID=A0ABW7TQF6_9NOCA|nr:wax ester/triacylglycerol synthase domain-containing protein [Nocardia carnea]